MNLTLKRMILKDDCTIGELWDETHRLCWCLEDTVRQPNVNIWKPENKLPGETAIPYGKYRIVMTYSERFKRVLPLLLDVPSFTGIRIHPGNRANDTEGCLLVGSTKSDDNTSIGNSKETFDKLYSILQEGLK